MPPPRTLRQQQRDEIHPLIRALAERIKRPYVEVAQDTGLTNYQIGRLLGEALPNPGYLDLTRLIVYTHMTPNEAASIVNLYNGDDEAMLGPEEQELFRLFRALALPERERRMFFSIMRSTLDALGEQTRYEEEREEREERQGRSQALPSLYDDSEAGAVTGAVASGSLKDE